MEVTQNLNVWEIEEYEALLGTLDAIMLSEEADKLVWTLNAAGSSTVRSFINT